MKTRLNRLTSTLYGRELSEVPYLDDGLFAGFPSPAEDHNLEAIDLTSELVKHPNTTFLARVVGDSMIDADIYEGISSL